MKKLKWNRKLSILVLIMFITVSFASFNTNLFINGKAYVRVDEAIRIVDIKLLDTEYDGYETMDPEYNKNTITMDANLPKQASSVTYQVSIQNTYPYDYDITDIIEENFTNKDVSYEIVGANKNTILPKNTTTTFTIKFTNNKTITEEEDVYQTLTYDFDYTGEEKTFVVPYTGTYTLEVWGAQGGNATSEIADNYIGGYGGYSKGEIELQKNQKLNINVGGAGITNTSAVEYVDGGYNGGGPSGYNSQVWIGSSGGGATHISFLPGELNKLEKYKGNLIDNTYYSSDKIIIVAGGGGGACAATRNEELYGSGNGGSGGGIVGSSGETNGNSYRYPAGAGGTQVKSADFRISCGLSGFGSYVNSRPQCGHGGPGGGFYAGNAGSGAAGGGGSGYIANPNLNNKVMYCYNCQESNEIQTKTISTNNHSQTPISNYAKEGNGYARLTVTAKIDTGAEYDYYYTGSEKVFTAPYTGIYKIETWGAQGGYYNKDYPGGYGGYSTGNISLEKNTNLYINVGGKGSYTSNSPVIDGGYNGGGKARGLTNYNVYSGSGGGASHIATESGLLNTFEEKLDKLLIVAGGGGGSLYYSRYKSSGGSGGGYIGNNASTIDFTQNYYWTGISTGGTQNTGGIGYNSCNTNDCEGEETNGKFGLGGTYNNGGSSKIAGGGAGYYGGGGSIRQAGGGGSGYIGNSLLTDKIMYCYECQESNDFNTKTVTTLSHSKTPKQNIAKEGNGYSKITLLKRQVNNAKLTLKFEFARHLYDYTITYDDNYLDNDMMYDLYNTFSYARCCPGPTDISEFPINGEINENGSLVTANKKSTCTQEAGGYYFGFKGNIDLEVGEVYEFSFEAKGNKEFTGNIGPEAGGRIEYTITPNWKKYSRVFTATDYRWRAFTMYSWGSVGDDRTLWIRNYQIHKYHEKTYPQYQATETKPVGENIAPTPFRDGWEFLGWYDDPIEGNKITAESNAPSEDTTYYAHWKQVNYNVEYDLDGGNVTGQPTSYYYLDNTKSIPNPTKEGYTFTGWTGGKNIFSYDYIYNNQHLGEGTTSATSGIRGLFDVKPNTYYTLSTNLPLRTDGGKYVIMKASDDFNEPITSAANGASADNTITVKSTANGHIIIAFFKSMMNSEMASKFETGEYWFQIEEGKIPTKYESFIETPQKSLTIPYYSSGNRHYKANWIKNYDIEYNLDGGTITGHPTTYNEETDTFTLPTPTKEGYTFAGWTGGKNLLDMSTAKGGYVSGMQCILNGDGTYRLKGKIEAEVESSPVNVWFKGTWADAADTLFTLSPGTYYIKDVSLFKNKGDINGGSGIYTFTKNVEVTGVRAPYVKTNTDYDEIRYPMIVEVEKPTSFEAYISTPQSITIEKGSNGNRKYTANWIKNE